MVKRIICGLLLSLFAVVPVTAATNVQTTDTKEVAWFGFGGGHRGYNSPYYYGGWGYGYPYSNYGYGYGSGYGYGYGGCSNCGWF